MLWWIYVPCGWENPDCKECHINALWLHTEITSDKLTRIILHWRDHWCMDNASEALAKKLHWAKQ